MPYLHNKAIRGEVITSNRWSFGPFVALDEDALLFDVRAQEFPRWLGYNASPLFGVTQFLETWTGQYSSRFERVKQAYIHLLERTRERFCGQVKLHDLEPDDASEVYSATPLKPAGVLYQYICLSILEQFEDDHRTAAAAIENHFESLIKSHGWMLIRHYVDGPNFEFGFECRDQEQANLLQHSLIKSGIWASHPARQIDLPDRFPVGSAVEESTTNESNRFAFQLNLSFREQEMSLFWERMRVAFESHVDPHVPIETVRLKRKSQIDATYQFHQQLINAKVQAKASKEFTAKSFLDQALKQYDTPLHAVIVTRKEYPEYREQFLAMQTEVYEPARRTPPEEFDMLFASENPISLIVLHGERIVAMAFAGQLGLFVQERGVSDDAYRDDPNCYYSMDLTIAEDYRRGLGRVMKQAMVLLALENGVMAIHGRNRDRLARGMWAINLSLGSFELQHLVDDYPDEGPHRDCIYYRCPLDWTEVDPDILNKINLSSAINGIGLKDVVLQDSD